MLLFKKMLLFCCILALRFLPLTILINFIIFAFSFLFLISSQSLLEFYSFIVV